MFTRPVARRTVLFGSAAPAAATYLPRVVLADAYPTFNVETGFGADSAFRCHPRGSRITGCTFTEAMGGTTNRYDINLNDVVEASPDGVPTTVTGPSVRWGNPLTGLTGTIPVGTYG